MKHLEYFSKYQIKTSLAAIDPVIERQKYGGIIYISEMPFSGSFSKTHYFFNEEIIPDTRYMVG